MNPSPETPEQKLERLVRQTVRELPPRRAPRTLEIRVLAELERRAALPWWHRSYAYWPAPVRLIFFVLTATVAAAVVAGLSIFVRHGLASEAVGELPWVHGFAAVRDSAAFFAEKIAIIFHAIPTLWLLGGGAVLGVCYATLIGVGAATYRLVRRQSPTF